LVLYGQHYARHFLSSFAIHRGEMHSPETLNLMRVYFFSDLFRYTELTVIAPKNGVIGLHARGLHIEQVLVDGVPASFELLQQQRFQKDQSQNGAQNGEHSLSSPSEAADVCLARYLAALDAEMSPELLIRPGEPATPLDASQDPPPFVPSVLDALKENGGVQPATPVDSKPTEVAPIQQVATI
jgi:hypothetical protein